MDFEDNLESIINDTIGACEEAVEAAEIKKDIDTSSRTKKIDVYIATRLSELVSFFNQYIVLAFVSSENGSLYQSTKESGCRWLLQSPIGPIRSLRRLYISKEDDTNANYGRFFVYASVMFFSLYLDWTQTFVCLTVLFASLSLSGHNRVEKVTLAGKIIPLSFQMAVLIFLALPMFYKFDFAGPVACATLSAFALTSVSYAVNELFHREGK